MTATGGSLSREERFGAALVEIEQALDWVQLGEVYCHEGGADFFDDDQLAAQREAALHFASDIGERLGSRPKGRSLYVGAGVAELAPILCDAILLRREVAVVALPGPESRELNRALEQAEGRLGFALPRWSTKPLRSLKRDGFDHLWMVSVLNDPEAFPALSKRLYERGSPPARSVGRDRKAASELLDEAFRRLDYPAVFATSEEELPLLEAAARSRGLNVQLAEAGRLSPIVGDVVRHGWIVR
ncbi:MAG: hypothetical protein ACYSWX_06530 [Planctomycetota bacterium]|jgi:hypothetical protein